MEQHLVEDADTSNGEDTEIGGLAVPGASVRSKAATQQEGDERRLHLHTRIARGVETANASDEFGDPNDPLNAHARTLSQNAKKKQVSPHKQNHSNLQSMSSKLLGLVAGTSFSSGKSSSPKGV
jgi:hypothetical protein